MEGGGVDRSIKRGVKQVRRAGGIEGSGDRDNVTSATKKVTGDEVGNRVWGKFDREAGIMGGFKSSGCVDREFRRESGNEFVGGEGVFVIVKGGDDI